jgi:radical SAM superfamily enzyme YgiQ (UPF0313 family)
MENKIILSTLNARYSHSSFGLRYLLANLRDLKDSAQILEFTISQNPRDITDQILKQNPKIVGFGVYIWNTDETLQVIQTIKKVSPETIIVLGGPEVSYESETQRICEAADFVIKGEADFSFYEFCKNYLSEGKLPSQKFNSHPQPDIKLIASPYPFYSDHDIQNRVIYVEASRGCPYKCEYCLSSLDVSVRNFDTDRFLADIDQLIQKGARQFKFIDRTFNLSPKISTQILQFFLDRIELGLFLHFEMVPDRLPDELKDLIVKFPKGALQFEIGIQTFNTEVAKNVSRRQNYDLVKENLLYLADHTGVHTHADLIVGLPGETMESFGVGFNTLYSYRPDEVQVGILKRLKGTPIIRHDQEFQMVYEDAPPFQILKNKEMSFSEIQYMSKFAKFWDLTANSGNFISTMKFILESESLSNIGATPFDRFKSLTTFMLKKHAESHSIALNALAETLFNFMKESGIEESIAKNALIQDFSRDEKRGLPAFLKYDVVFEKSATLQKDHSKLPKRQQKHIQ